MRFFSEPSSLSFLSNWSTSLRSWRNVGTVVGSNLLTADGLNGTHTLPVFGCTQNGAFSKWFAVLLTEISKRGQRIDNWISSMRNLSFFTVRLACTLYRFTKSHTDFESPISTAITSFSNSFRVFSSGIKSSNFLRPSIEPNIFWSFRQISSKYCSTIRWARFILWCIRSPGNETRFVELCAVNRFRYSATAFRFLLSKWRAALSQTQQWIPRRPLNTHRMCSKLKSSVELAGKRWKCVKWVENNENVS